MSFKIDTIIVGDAASNIKTVADKCTTLKDKVSGYDVSCEGDFDFSAAKAAIENNLQGAETKFNNTVALLTAVVNAHGGLQNSVGTASSSSSSSTSSSSSGYSSSSYSGYSSSGYTSGGSTVTYTTTGSSDTTTTSTTTPSTTPSTNETSTTESDDTQSNITDADALQQATQETGAAKAISIDTLTKVDDVITQIDVKEITADEIEAETKGKNSMIVEGISSSKECAKYLVTVSEVTDEYDIAVKYIRLDKVVKDPNAATSKLCDSAVDSFTESKTKVIDKYNEISETKLDYTSDWGTAYVATAIMDAGYAKYNRLLVDNAEEMKKAFSEYNMYEEAESDTKPSPGSVIFIQDDEGNITQTAIVESVDDDGTINLIEGNYGKSDLIDTVAKASYLKVGDSNIAGYGVLVEDNESTTNIIDQTAYDKLTKLNSTEDIDVDSTPITIIIKDDKVVNSLTGCVNATVLEAAIVAAGITKKTSTTTTN